MIFWAVVFPYLFSATAGTIGLAGVSKCLSQCQIHIRKLPATVYRSPRQFFSFGLPSRLSRLLRNRPQHPVRGEGRLISALVSSSIHFSLRQKRAKFYQKFPFPTQCVSAQRGQFDEQCRPRRGASFPSETCTILGLPF